MTAGEGTLKGTGTLRGTGRRALVVVIDACGVGALPDAARYGDEGTNTLAHLARALGGLRLPTLQRLGLGSIVEVEGVAPERDAAIHGRLAPLGPGKDSITGHWELMGVVTQRELPTYPEGFPPALIARLEAAMGRALICNLPYNGIAAIDKFGAEHLRTGALIVYTSQDSVLQLAAHVERVAESELYEACAAARELMRGKDGVGRVIARPFAGAQGAFERTHGRHDFARAQLPTGARGRGRAGARGGKGRRPLLGGGHLALVPRCHQRDGATEHREAVGGAR
jgi:phosphopentomutase